MACCIQSGLEEKVYTCADTITEVQGLACSAERDLFIRQVGQMLYTLGKVFVRVRPFSDHIDRKTGELLISLGRKLRKY